MPKDRLGVLVLAEDNPQADGVSAAAVIAGTVVVVDPAVVLPSQSSATPANIDACSLIV